jgi:hypothetical protein
MGGKSFLSSAGVMNERPISSKAQRDAVPRIWVTEESVMSQIGDVSGGDIVLGENHKTSQNRKRVLPQHLQHRILPAFRVSAIHE